MTRRLILVRHGQSEGNRADLFTGWLDADLSADGHAEAKVAGTRLKERGLHVDAAFTSVLQRARKTLDHILAALGQDGLSPLADAALNERDYGILTGMTKNEARRRWAPAEVDAWRRSYDRAPPDGESLRDTGARVWPFYLARVLPSVLRGGTALTVAHGNSLRALMMATEGTSGETVARVEIPTGVPILYEIGSDSRVLSKEVLDR